MKDVFLFIRGMGLGRKLLQCFAAIVTFLALIGLAIWSVWQVVAALFDVLIDLIKRFV